jgi:preprotein translocase subunit SecD
MLFTGYYIIPSMGLVGNLPSQFPGFLPRAERVNLGLDLQGGMHLVLEVQVEKAVENATDRLMDEARRILDKQKIGISTLTRQGTSEIVLKKWPSRRIGTRPNKRWESSERWTRFPGPHRMKSA